jgi:hypothetical protein
MDVADAAVMAECDVRVLETMSVVLEVIDPPALSPVPSSLADAVGNATMLEVEL